MDPYPTIDFIDTIFSIAQSIIVSAGIIIGFFTWKSQIVKKARYEAAKKLLQSVIAVKAQVNKFRAAFVSSGESATAMENQGIKPNEDFQRNSNLSSAAVLRERWQKVFEKYSDYELMKIESMAILDVDLDEITKDFEACIRTIFSATNMFIQHYERLGSGQKGIITNKMYLEMSQTIYGDFDIDGKGDKFENDISKSIKGVKDSLEKHLSLK